MVAIETTVNAIEFLFGLNVHDIYAISTHLIDRIIIFLSSTDLRIGKTNVNYSVLMDISRDETLRSTENPQKAINFIDRRGQCVVGVFKCQFFKK